MNSGGAGDESRRNSGTDTKVILVITNSAPTPFDIVSIEEVRRMIAAPRVARYKVFFFTRYRLGLRLGCPPTVRS